MEHDLSEGGQDASAKQGGRSGLVIGGFLFAMGEFGSIAVLNARLLDSRVEGDKHAVQALVIKKEFLRAADGDSDYLITYRFQLPDGRELTSQRGITRGDWRKLKEGQSVEVLYAADNPNRNFPRGGGVTQSGAIAAGVVFGLVGLLGGAVLVAAWRERQRRRRTASWPKS